MTNFLTKTNLPNYCNKQLLLIFTLFLLGCYLTLETHSLLYSIGSLLFLTFYSYFIHYLCHKLPDVISIHLTYHHVPQAQWWIRALHLLIETIVNIGFFGIIYGLQRLLQIQVIPTILIVYYGMIYVSVHIINYSLCHASPKHVIHHTTSDPSSATDDSKQPTTPTTPATLSATKNYGPDSIDHLFGTNDDETFEDFNHMIPNILISFAVMWYFYRHLDKKAVDVCLDLVPVAVCNIPSPPQINCRPPTSVL